MWALLVVAFCAVYLTEAVILHQDIGPVHVQTNVLGLPRAKYLPMEQYELDASDKLAVLLRESIPTWDTTIKRSVHDIVLNELTAIFGLYLYDLVLKGFQHATLHNLELRLKNGRLDFNASIPLLSTTCTVFMNGMIDNNTYGTVGNLSTAFKDVEITGMLIYDSEHLPETYTEHSLVYQIVDADVTIDIKDFVVQLKIIEELDGFKMILAKFLNKPKEDVVKSVTRAVLRIINDQLAKISALDNQNLIFKSSTSPLRRSLRSRTPNNG